MAQVAAAVPRSLDAADVEPQAMPFFDRLCPSLLRDGEWTTVHEESGVVMARKAVSADVSLLRAQYNIDLSFDDALAMMRPDVMWNPRLSSVYGPPPAAADQRSDLSSPCGVEQLLAPGDAICWIRPRLDTKYTALAMKRAAVSGSTKHAFDRSLQGSTKYFRWMLRSGFPLPGDFSVVAAPFCPESGALFEEDGFRKSLTAVFSAHPDDPNSCAVVEAVWLRRTPDWSIRHLLGIFLHRLKRVQLYKQSPLYGEVLGGAFSYVVVGLSKVAKGPPLLPKNIPVVEGVTFDSGWEATSSPGTCASYLQDFLRCLGIKVVVYESLDGQSLVYYQAALSRDDWLRASAALESGSWRAHGAAYRKAYGGKNAPKIAIAEPKFRTRAAITAALAASTGRACWAEAQVPVINTFVQYSPVPDATLQRTNSFPRFGAMV